MIGDWLVHEQLWRSALAVIPVAVLVACICRLLPARPSTRHVLWLVVLGALVAMPFLPAPRLPATENTALVAPPAPPEPAPAALPETNPAPALVRAAPYENPKSSVGILPRRVPPPPAGTVTPRPARTHPTEVQRPSRPPAADPPAFSNTNHRPLRNPTPGTAPGVKPGPAHPPAATDRTSTPAVTIADDSAGAAAPPAPASRWRALLSGEHDWSAEWQAWVAQLSAIRDSVMGLPPLPLSLWVGGLAVILIVGAGRVSRSSRLVRAARPAPPSVEAVVADASRRMGLRRAPTTLMIDQNISPMLWCGRRNPRLLLPDPLWRQLDPAGRSAVVAHELAHLRRRDHWVCWVEMLVGALYWWHPVVWWVRRRLREEADLACDAWVTALHPRSRRAYAQALLDTRRISARATAVPAVGLGARSFRAKRFARRLTMVMTSRLSPRLSVRGFMLAGGVALAAYVASPLWACPPEEKRVAKGKADAPAPKHKVLVPAAPKPPKAPRADTPPAPPTPRAAPAPPGTTTFEQFMRDRRDRENLSLEERILELERQIELLHRHLQQMQGPRGLGGGGGAGGIPGPMAGRSLDLAPLAAALGMSGGPAPVAQDGNCLAGAAVMGGETVVRTYALPEGKREALSALMIRGDVPIRVRQTDRGIEVHASPAQHCIFEMFVRMIDGKDRVEAHVLPEGKLEALTELMIRSDVPILVEPDSDEIRVHGTDVEQAVFDAFCRLIHPGDVTVSELSAADAYAIAADRARHYETQATAHVTALNLLRNELRALESQLRTLERQSERRGEQAERLFEKADEAENDAERLFDEASEAGEGRGRSVIDRAERVRAQAKESRARAEALEMEAAMLEEEAERIEQVIDQLEQQIEDIEEAAEDEDD